MFSTTSPESLPLPQWQRPTRTTENLEWANIKVIDLTDFEIPGTKGRLAEELRNAVRLLYHRLDYF